MKNKKITATRKFLIAEGILVLGALAYLFFSMAPAQDSFIVGKTIFEPDFVFELGEGEEMLISVDENFESPIVLGMGEEVDLPPGTYYYKIRNWLREGEIKTFTIESDIGLSFSIEKPQERVVEDRPGITSGVGGEEE